MIERQLQEGSNNALVTRVFAIDPLPIIRRLDGIAKQAWYADYSAAASCLENSRGGGWDTLTEIGTLYGYFPSDGKTHILPKSSTSTKLGRCSGTL